MQNDILAFCTKLAGYINAHIAGKENSCIEKCDTSFPCLNRGHSISVFVKPPKGFPEKQKPAMVFYAEELLAQMPDATTAAIAETMNHEAAENYNHLLSVLSFMNNAENMDLDSFDKRNVIISASPAAYAEKQKKNGVITKDLPACGLTLILKAKDDALDNAEGQSYFLPVRKPKNRKITEKDWKNAEQNCLRIVKPAVMPIPARDDDKSKSLGMVLYDTASFYDYFYLVSPEKIWKDIAKKYHASKIYVFPMAPYWVIFLPDTADGIPEILLTRKTLLRSFWKLQEAAETGIPPVVLDCSNWSFSEYTE